MEVESFPEDVLDGIWGKGEWVRKEEGVVRFDPTTFALLA